jgi:hypothetical protein
MSRPRWYARRGPVTVTLAAGVQMHRVTWRDGRLVLHDHDPAAEAVLQALGGEPELCPCLLLRDALRGPLAGWLPSPPAPTWTSGLPVAAPRQPLQRPLLDPNVRWLIRRLPPERRSRLLGEHRAQVAAQVAARVLSEPLREIVALVDEVRAARRSRRTGGRQRPVPEQLLQAAAAPALEESMRHAQGRFRPAAALSIGCWRQSPGEIPILDGDLTSRGGFVALSLPVRWLNRVWKRGLACVDGVFVLDVEGTAPATDLRAAALRWEPRLGGHAVPVATPCRIRKGAGRWRLTWNGEAPG